LSTSTGDNEVRPGPTSDSAGRIEHAALLLGSLLLVWIGVALDPLLAQGSRWQSWPIIGLGVSFFFLSAWGFRRGELPRPIALAVSKLARWFGMLPAGVWLLLLALMMSLAARLGAGDGPIMRHPWLPTAAWLAAIGLLVLGTWENWQAGPGGRPSRAEIAAILTIFLAALLLRGLRIGEIPWLLTGDEASGGISAAEFAQGRRDNLFSIGWFSFPALFFFVESLPLRLLGQTTEALRVPSVLAGALTVFALYFYARAAFGRATGLAAAIYLAAFHFHVHFSRLGISNVWDGLFAVLVAGGLWWGWKTGRRSAFAITGLALGLSQYFYVSGRILFALIPIWFILGWLVDRRMARQRLPGFVLMGIAAFVVLLPLALFFTAHPGEFQAPIQRVTIAGQWLASTAQKLQVPEWRVVLMQFRDAALGFTSLNLRHWYQPGHPMLLQLPGALFLLGICLLLLNPRDMRHSWLGLWLLGGIVVSALSQDTPAAQRYLLVSPAVALLVALPLVEIPRWLARAWPNRGRLFLVGAALALTVAVAADLAFYFGDYTSNFRFGDNNTETAQAVADYLQNKPPGLKVYFFGGRMGYYSHSTIPYLAPDAIGEDVLAPLATPPDWPLTGPTMFIFLPERQGELELVEGAYPGGKTTLHEGREVLLFVAYEAAPP